MNTAKLDFYLGRIKSMSFPELIYRAKWKIKLDTYYRWRSFFSKNESKKLNPKLNQKLNFE